MPDMGVVSCIRRFSLIKNVLSSVVSLVVKVLIVQVKKDLITRVTSTYCKVNAMEISADVVGW